MFDRLVKGRRGLPHHHEPHPHAHRHAHGPPAPEPLRAAHPTSSLSWRTRRSGGPGDQPEFNPIARMYKDMFLNGQYVFEEKYGRNLVGAFQEVSGHGQGGDHHLLSDPRVPAAPDGTTATPCAPRSWSPWSTTKAHRQGPEGHLAAGVRLLRGPRRDHAYLGSGHPLFFHGRSPHLPLLPGPSTASTHLHLLPLGRGGLQQDIESSKRVWAPSKDTPATTTTAISIATWGFDLDYNYVRPYPCTPTGRA